MGTPVGLRFVNNVKTDQGHNDSLFLCSTGFHSSRTYNVFVLRSFILSSTLYFVEYGFGIVYQSGSDGILLTNRPTPQSGSCSC